MNARSTLLAGSISAGLSIILGAFGAHALKSKLSAEMMQVYHTATHYQMFDSLALLIIGILMIIIVDKNQSIRYFKLSARFFLIGLILFCGSLYALAITSIKILGIITPFGGLCFILGWIFASLGIWNMSKK
jgi:uncharacterized membrane protein YgdD (TMEM256/DUF423 family)